MSPTRPLNILANVLLSFLLSVSAACAEGSEQPDHFPIGIYGNMSKGTHKKVMAAGFDTVTIPPHEQLLRSVADDGLKAVIMFHLTRSTAASDEAFRTYLENMSQSVAKFKDNKAVIAWHVADEPDGNSISIEKFAKACATVKAIDPSHRVFAVFNSPDRWKPYMEHVDIVGIDPYMRQTPSGRARSLAEYQPTDVVRQWIVKARSDIESLSPTQKPIWVVLQAFEYSFEDPSLISPYKPPSTEELDEMMKLSLEQNIQGLFFYSFGFPSGINAFTGKPYKAWNIVADRPDLWQFLTGINERVQRYKKWSTGK